MHYLHYRLCLKKSKNFVDALMEYLHNLVSLLLMQRRKTEVK
jgi:hypothetical protein